MWQRTTGAVEAVTGYPVANHSYSAAEVRKADKPACPVEIRAGALSTFPPQIWLCN